MFSAYLKGTICYSNVAVLPKKVAHTKFTCQKLFFVEADEHGATEKFQITRLQVTIFSSLLNFIGLIILITARYHFCHKHTLVLTYFFVCHLSLKYFLIPLIKKGDAEGLHNFLCQTALDSIHRPPIVRYLSVTCNFFLTISYFSPNVQTIINYLSSFPSYLPLGIVIRQFKHTGHLHVNVSLKRIALFFYKSTRLHTPQSFSH